MFDTAADDLRSAATSVGGVGIAVAEFTAGRSVWNSRQIASQESAVVVRGAGRDRPGPAAALHLHLEPLTLRQLVVRAAADWVCPSRTPVTSGGGGSDP